MALGNHMLWRSIINLKYRGCSKEVSKVTVLNYEGSAIQQYENRVLQYLSQVPMKHP